MNWLVRCLVLCSVWVMTITPARAAGEEEVRAGAPTLKAGDAAPPLVVDKWVKGGPIDKLEKGKVYVLEFWATWCGPCLAAMPHVTMLQKRYADRGVVMIGVNVWERDPGKVEPFVQEMGGKIGYAVATDVVADAVNFRAGRMANTWMKSAGRDTIPTTFIVDREGRIAWIGDPRAMDRALKLVAAGQLDPAAEAELQKQRLADEAVWYTAIKEGRWNDSQVALDRLVAANADSLASLTLHGVPYGVHKLQQLVGRGNYAMANELAAKLADALPDVPLREDGNPTVREQILNAMTAVPDPDLDLKKLDTDLLLRLAERVVQEAAKDWHVQSQLANVHAARGEYDKAVEAQQRAVAGVPAGQRRQWQETRLKIYQDKAAAAAPTILPSTRRATTRPAGIPGQQRQ